jgi:anti-sigma factor RsiW
MECLDNIQQICEALGEDIDSPLCKEIQEHLAECPRCCAEVDSIKKVVHLYQRIGDSDVPEAVDQRLWKVLNLQKPAR